MPGGLKIAIDRAVSPPVLTACSFAVLAILYLGRGFFVRSAVAWSLMNGGLLWFGALLADREFAARVLPPDNLPIVGLIFLLGLFLWSAVYQAVENDRRLARAEPPVEKERAASVFVWPDLVYTELICMILITALLLAWSMCVKAPLESPANPADAQSVEGP